MSDNIYDLDDYTGRDEWHSVYTIQLNQLIESGVFDWTNPLLDWSTSAYDVATYARVCSYFNARFGWREIGILPIKQWFNTLHWKIVYELCPRFNPMYAAIANGINPLMDDDEYYKERAISSDYPETLLAGNSDYISSGHDREYERVHELNTAEQLEKYARLYRPIDEQFLDELEVMFISSYSLNVNGL